MPKLKPYDTEPEALRSRILHILSIYPIISPTMLQGGLGPATKPRFWRPVLTKLVEDGLVIREQESLLTPTERYNTYLKIRLPGTTVVRGGVEEETVSSDDA